MELTLNMRGYPQETLKNDLKEIGYEISESEVSITLKRELDPCSPIFSYDGCFDKITFEKECNKINALYFKSWSPEQPKDHPKVLPPYLQFIGDSKELKDILELVDKNYESLQEKI